MNPRMTSHTFMLQVSHARTNTGTHTSTLYLDRHSPRHVEGGAGRRLRLFPCPLERIDGHGQRHVVLGLAPPDEAADLLVAYGCGVMGGAERMGG